MDGKMHWGWTLVIALIAFAIATVWNPITWVRAKAGV